MSMRITHVIFGFTTGGAELMLADIMAEQAEAGHEVSLVVINHHYEEALLRTLHPRVKQVLVDRPEGSRNPWWVLLYNIALRRTRPDVVHFHQSRGAYITRAIKGVPFVLTMHDTGIAKPPHPRRIQRVFAISEAVADDIRRRFKIEPTVVPNGIACRAILPKDDNDPPYSTAAGRPLRMITVARLMHEKKGQDLAIRAVADLAARGIPSTLDIIGTGKSEAYLRQLAEECGVADRVHFLGNRTRSEIYSTLHGYDLFLLPSRYEGFGLTVAEAMAAQVPVVVSDIEGPMEIIEGGRYGSHFRSDDHRSLADTIERVARDYSRFAALARTEAFSHVRSRYDIALTARRYLESYPPRG